MKYSLPILASVVLLVSCNTAPPQPNDLTPIVASTDLRISDYGWGAKPLLVAPTPQSLPTLKAARAIGWPQGRLPVPAKGLKVTAYARGLEHPRWMTILPNGDVLVAETDTPRGSSRSGVMAWLSKRVMRFAGSGYPSADRITLLRGLNSEGGAEIMRSFLEGLHSPFGMTLIGSTLYVANTDAIVAFDYQKEATELEATGREIASLPANAPNSHWTKNIQATADGTGLYVAVGSNSNIGEQGAAAEQNRAAILRLNLLTGDLEPFARGLRNPVGMALHPKTGELWAVVNERDQLGNDLVPDYLTRVNAQDDFGWPTYYWGLLQDPRVSLDWDDNAPEAPDRLSAAKAPVSDSQRPPMRPRRVPDYALGAHTASLGIAFYPNDGSIAALRGHAIISQRGSWNRNPRSGYQVIAIPFDTLGNPVGQPKPVLTGFLDEREQAMGRPVGVAIDGQGAVLITDDVGGVVWRVTNAS